MHRLKLKELAVLAVRKGDKMSVELWKEVVGFSQYCVSSKGRVFSKYRNRLIKPIVRKDGYVFLTLNKKGKQYNKFLHRLVAEAFILNLSNYKQVNHKDEDKTNNCVENLEWCNSKYNMNYGKKAKQRIQNTIEKTRKEVFAYYADTKEKIGFFKSEKEAGKALNVPFKAISAVCNGKKKRYKNYFFKFANAVGD